MKSKIFLALLILFALIQFIPVDKTNPPLEPEKDFISAVQPPQEMARLIKAACYDCHSHETVYPWYSSIAPVSIWTRNHAVEGRKHLNFSLWKNYDAKKANHKLEECHEKVEATEMPLLPYILAHPEAKMSKSQRAELVAYFKTLASN